MENYNKTIDEIQERIKNLNETKDKLLETVHKIADEITYNAHVINLFAYHKDQIEEIIMNWCVKNKLSYKMLSSDVIRNMQSTCRSITILSDKLHLQDYLAKSIIFQFLLMVIWHTM